MNATDGIRSLSSRIANAATVDPAAAILNCPGWTMVDLVRHLADVQWFWADIVERRVTSRLDRRRPPDMPTETTAVEWLLTQSAHLVDVLAGIHASTTVWTWCDAEQSVGFVQRRQLIEAAIHCFDAENAVGVAWSVPIDVAVEGLDEFLDVMSDDIRPGAQPSPVTLMATDVKWQRTLFPGGARAPMPLAAPAQELLLTLWGRRTADDGAVAASIACIDLT